MVKLPFTISALVISAIALVFLMLTPALPAHSMQVATPTPSMGGFALFRDDFQDGLAPEWQISSGWQLVREGDNVYFGGAGEGLAWVAGGGGWGDYVLRVPLRIDYGTASLSYRATADGRYIVIFSPDGMSLVKEYPRGEFTTLAQTVAPQQDSWHWVAVCGEGGHIQVYVDRVLWLDYTDQAPLLQGTIALGSAENSQVLAGTVMVTRLARPLPAVDPAVVVPDEPIPLPADAEPPPAIAPAPGGGEPADVPGAEISFLVEGGESATVDPGQCVTVQWDVEHIMEVYFQGQGVTGHEFRDVCPDQTTTYILEVVHVDGSVTEHAVTVYVNEGSAPAAGMPDLVFESISVLPSVPTVPGIVMVALTVRNLGDADAGAFTVRWYPHARSSEVGCSMDVAGIPAQGAVALNCSYEYPSHGNMHWLAVVDADGDVAESDEGNNETRGEVLIEQQ